MRQFHEAFIGEEEVHGLPVDCGLKEGLAQNGRLRASRYSDERIPPVLLIVCDDDVESLDHFGSNGILSNPSDSVE